ncbi:MAG: hypothetical protein ACFNP8_04160, partial [Alloprevotella sp.]
MPVHNFYEEGKYRQRNKYPSDRASAGSLLSATFFDLTCILQAVVFKMGGVIRFVHFFAVSFVYIFYAHSCHLLLLLMYDNIPTDDLSANLYNK